jgi:hypothetical protein
VNAEENCNPQECKEGPRARARYESYRGDCGKDQKNDRNLLRGRMERQPFRPAQTHKPHTGAGRIPRAQDLGEKKEEPQE